MINDCCRGVSFDDIESTKKNFKAANGIIVESHQVCSSGRYHFEPVYPKKTVLAGALEDFRVNFWSFGDPK